MEVRRNYPCITIVHIKKFEILKAQEIRKRKGREKVVRMVKAYKAKIKSQKELDEHRRGGHAQYSPDCPECKRGYAKQRSHRRLPVKMGGELSIDVAGPYVEGLPVTDRREKKELWPRYMLVGAFVPFPHKEAKQRYER